MKRVTPLKIDNKQLFETIVEHKLEPTKSRLSSIKDFINEDYILYENNKFALERLNSDGRVSEYKYDLINCYKSGKKISSIKKAIKENIPQKMRGKCLYCMISEPTTIDHYMDKDDFPEYSIYTDNLIPCCPICNNKKGTDWANKGKRLFINCYYDDLLEEEFLFIDVDLKDGIPFIKNVRLDFSKVNSSSEQVQMIITHFQKLDLINRYRDIAVSYLSTIMDEMIIPSKMSLVHCKEFLCRRINALKKNFGINYWETAVCRGILDNKALMDWLSKS